MDPNRLISREQAKRLKAVAPTRRLKVETIALRVPRTSEELDRAFKQAARTSDAVLVIDDPDLSAQRPRIVALAAKYRLPEMHVSREYVDAGGLMAYAPDVPAMFRHAADYVDKILQGAKPADLPNSRPSTCSLSISRLRRSLGLPSLSRFCCAPMR